MIESITTLTPAQQVAAVQAKESDISRMKIHEAKHSNSEFKNSEERKHDKLTEFEQLLQRSLALSNQSVHISMDDVTKRMIVRIVDNSTNEVVRQLPTEEMLRISRNIAEHEMTHGNITDVRI